MIVELPAVLLLLCTIVAVLSVMVNFGKHDDR